MQNKEINIGNISFSNNKKFVLIAGPCVIENEEMILRTAEKIMNVTSKLDIPYIFKSSFKKANRTSLNSFTGLNLDKALNILKKVKDNFGLQIVTDIHTAEDANTVKDIVDILQIPAFLCRQTDLLVAAANTRKVINVKKGQFLAPEDMKHAIEKIASTGNDNILLTERGTTFGYHNLVVDMRGIEVMKDFGYPVVMDATHSVQIPSQGNISGGMPRFIEPLAKAAISLGIAGVFMEVHPEPLKALSDAGSQLKLDDLEAILIKLKKIDAVVKSL